MTVSPTITSEPSLPREDLRGRELARELSEFAGPVLWKSLWQLANSFVPMLACFYLSYRSLEISTLLAIGFSLLACGFNIRLGMIQHDCGHGSFFRSRTANAVAANLSAILGIFPYGYWKARHAIHHFDTNNLTQFERSPFFEFLTVKEYQALRPFWRWVYRLIHRPFIYVVLLGAPAAYLYLRSTISIPKDQKKWRMNVHATNVAMAVTLGLLGMTIGFGELAIIYLPNVILAGAVGMWLVTIQHRFDGAKWFQDDDWDYQGVALEGTSFLNLPRLFQWFIANMGYHNVHHLDPRIPNYNLQKCYESIPALQRVPEMNFRESLRALNYNVWDDDRQTFIRARDVSATAAPDLDTAPIAASA